MCMTKQLSNKETADLQKSIFTIQWIQRMHALHLVGKKDLKFDFIFTSYDIPLIYSLMISFSISWEKCMLVKCDKPKTIPAHSIMKFNAINFVVAYLTLWKIWLFNNVHVVNPQFICNHCYSKKWLTLSLSVCGLWLDVSEPGFNLLLGERLVHIVVHFTLPKY